MKIDSIQVGPIMTNCYLLCDDAAGVCCVIDPGDEPARVEQMVQRSGCELRYILLTHGHFDHCTGVAGMLERHPELPVYICEKDVTDGVGSEMQFARLPEKNQRYYKDGDTLTLGALTISVLETPGHTPGSSCYIGDGVIFSGDTLFAGGAGRTDFPGGDEAALRRSLKRLAALEGDYRVFPGHEESTTLQRERLENPYVNGFFEE